MFMVDMGQTVPGVRWGSTRRDARGPCAVGAVVSALAVMAFIAGHWRRGRAVRTALRDERKWIARDLHDVVSHRLVVIALQARQLQALDERVVQVAQAIDDLAQNAGEDLRRAVGQLRKPAPEPGDLVEEIVGDAARVPGERVVVTVASTDHQRVTTPLPPATRRAAMRVFHECVTNALKHGVGRVQVHVDFGRELSMRVVNRCAEDKPVRRGGVGLGSMQDQAAEQGGRVRFSRTGGIFRVDAMLPVGSAAVTRGRRYTGLQKGPGWNRFAS